MQSRKLLKTLRHPVRYILLRNVYKRLETLEYRSCNRRFYAIEQITEYLIGAQIPGDYAEFGVYQGATFIHAYKNMSHHFKQMRFHAFDSFEGLPELKGNDKTNGYTSHFYEGQFTCSKESFINNLKKHKINMDSITVNKGWFDSVLSDENSEKINIDKISVAWIDCDLYEFTVPVLSFLTKRISVGSVIIFDDWRCFRNHPDFGEQKACNEWLSSNPNISLQELFSFGWNGMVFTVTSC